MEDGRQNEDEIRQHLPLLALSSQSEPDMVWFSPLGPGSVEPRSPPIQAGFRGLGIGLGVG